jgi:hypothetical protein
MRGERIYNTPSIYSSIFIDLMSDLMSLQTLTPAQRLVDAAQRCDIDREALAVEVSRQCQSLHNLPTEMSSLLEDLMQKRGTLSIRKICQEIQQACDERGCPVLERTCDVLLNQRIPQSVSDPAHEAMEQQRWQQRRRASGEELEDEDRYAR